MGRASSSARSRTARQSSGSRSDDTGPGIAEKDADHIFEPLYTTKADGIGMGLAIARTIVDAHGGRLTAANNEDGGATFQFTLPVDTVGRAMTEPPCRWSSSWTTIRRCGRA